MKVIYISTLTTHRLANQLFKESGKNIGFAVQKFNRLIVNGLVKNGVTVQTLTGLPISRNISSKKIWNFSDEKENDVKYKYIPFINIPGFRHACLFFYSFIYTLFWGIYERKEKCIICDVLNISICIGSLLASKLIRLRSVGIMTDMPGLMVSQDTNNKKSISNIVSTINKSYLTSFSYYVFLTEQMNVAINRKHRPYIVMEGLVNDLMKHSKSPLKENHFNKRVLLYAGGLHERYGLKKLVEAFIKIEATDIQLSLYGNGPFVRDLNTYCIQDPRIVYHGIVSNDKVVEAEQTALLLINPRPTTEKFTQYSFPSKNMEYMVSGTPILTTKLPGMPEEYYPYIYIIEDESVEGYAKSINDVLNLPEEELRNKGNKARLFVLNNKNNISQTKRIIDLVNN